MELKLHHINFCSTDVAAMDEFYRGDARVERYNPRLHSIIATDIPGARKRAKAADRALSKGEVWGPLHGVPMTIKEPFPPAAGLMAYGRRSISRWM